MFKVGFGEGRLLGSGSRDLDVLEHRRNLGKVEFSSVFLSFSSKVWFSDENSSKNWVFLGFLLERS